MAAITIKSFGGISPKTPARYLQESQAQVALNCPVFNGPLQPLYGLGAALLTLDKATAPVTIYRYGQDTISDTQYWFHWLTDVDVCRSQIKSDSSEWTFYTGDGVPKATYAALALTGTNYPAASRPLGVEPPVTAVLTAVSGTPTDPAALVETRVYAYTNVSKEAGFEKESSPSAPSAEVAVRPGQTVTLTSFDAVPAGYNVTHRRIYRAVAGVYLYVDEITSAETSFADSVLAEDLNEELPSLTWEEPPDGLMGLTNLPNGIMAGAVGRDLYFCDPYHPFAWPSGYMQTVDYPVVGLGRMDTTLAVLTTGAPYFVQGTHPDSMAVVKSDIEQACVAKRSIVSVGGAVLYASPDGLVLLAPGGSRILTEGYFSRKQWQAYFKPSSIHAYVHDNKYVAFYDTGTVQGGFIYDLTSNQFVLHNLYATAGYSDLVVDKLFVALAARTVREWDAGTALSYVWRSKKFGLPNTNFFSCAQLEAETYPVTVKFYVDGNATAAYTLSVTSREPFRLPATLAGRDWEVQLEGNTDVFSFAMAQSMGELANV